MQSAGESAPGVRTRRAEVLLKDLESLPERGACADLFARAEDARTEALSLLNGGESCSSAIAALALAEAILNNDARIRQLMDYDRFLASHIVAAPQGIPVLQFHSLLTEEIKSGLKYYEAPDELAVRNAWVSLGIGAQGRAGRALRSIFRREVDDYIATHPADDRHPFLASCPSMYTLEAWGVVSGEKSYHRSHIHPRAWLTGVYYVSAPRYRDSATLRGCLRIGPPAGISVNGWDVRTLEPRPGRLILMPGYFYHDVLPTETGGERICIAFDVVRAERSGVHSDTAV